MPMNKKEEMTRKYQPRKLEELNLLDNFLFQEMMFQKEIREEFGKILLSTILGRPIQKIRIIPQNNVLGINTEKHGIRMDAYIEEIPEALQADVVPEDALPDVYDIEPNKIYEKGRKLPRRMRYYHGLIDTKLLSPEQSMISCQMW